MIALDLDGTLVDYAPEGPRPRINYDLITTLAAHRVRHVAICTNQGGLPWHVMGVQRADGRPYPSPAQFRARLLGALGHFGIAVAAVRVSVFHPRADPAAIGRAARMVRADLSGLNWLDWTVYTTAAARKPNPLMLRSVGATEYWGDSDKDARAAARARIAFVKVERFGG